MTRQQRPHRISGGGLQSSFGDLSAFMQEEPQIAPTEGPLTPETFDRSTLRPLDMRWAWAEVDSSAIRHNINEFRKCVSPQTQLLAVLKADAYGHGAVECAKLALEMGVSWLAVATVFEGIELRDAGIDAPVLLLSQPPEEAIEALLAFGIVPTVYTVDFALALGEAAAAHGMTADYHLAINTGMNRIGVWYDDVMEFLRMVSFHRCLNLQGTFTHFATADAHDDFNFKVQLNRFNEALDAMRAAGIDPGIVHCANSAAGVRYAESYFDMVRLGICMYGLHPSTATRRMIELKPAMSVHARVVAVNDVAVGEGVSYDLSYRSPGHVKIATLPLGYADGLSRLLSNRMDVLFKGRVMPQVGNICMDMCMFEIDRRSTLMAQAPDVQIGDEALIVGSDGDYAITLDDMADKLGTINYELACRFGMRLPRVWV